VDTVSTAVVENKLPRGFLQKNIQNLDSILNGQNLIVTNNSMVRALNKNVVVLLQKEFSNMYC
jgi:hypothetical protein